jgi:hypothetical protein
MERKSVAATYAPLVGISKHRSWSAIRDVLPSVSALLVQTCSVLLFGVDACLCMALTFFCFVLTKPNGDWLSNKQFKIVLHNIHFKSVYLKSF